MTLHLDSATIGRLATDDVALQAARVAVRMQADGAYVLPPRIDVDVPAGFFRVMPAALGEYMGAKVMTLAKGHGNRYLLLVCRQDTGELLATLDAAEVTRLRTAATTAVAGELLCPAGTDILGLVGTGFEADGHLRAFARLWPLSKVLVYSRSADKRRAFASRLGTDLGISVVPVESVDEVVGASPVTVLCTKSTEPVAFGADFAPNAAVLSIGSTRPSLRELDEATFARAGRVLVDDPVQVLAESGDVAAAVAAGSITPSTLLSMASWSFGEADAARAAAEGRDLLVFKSVGTALQDLALAVALLAGAREQGLGRELGELAELKIEGKKAQQG